MSQAIGTAGNIQLNASFVQCVAGVAFIGIIFKSDLPNYAAYGMSHVITGQISGLKAIIRDSLVIVIAGGIALGVNQLINTLCPALSASTLPVLEGSIKVAQFVAAVFTLKANLSPFIDTAFHLHSISLQQKAARYLCPLVISLFTAHYFNFQIKIAESAALTGGIFVLMKVLASGLQNIWGNNSSGAPTKSWSNSKSIWPMYQQPQPNGNKPGKNVELTEEDNSVEKID
jgi:hypothetical protein